MVHESLELRGNGPLMHKFKMIQQSSTLALGIDAKGGHKCSCISILDKDFIGKIPWHIMIKL